MKTKRSAFSYGKKRTYSYEVKIKAIKMKLVGGPNEVIMAKLGIKNKTQIETWVRWYQKGEAHRLQQPIGKQYSFGHGPEKTSKLEQVMAENEILKVQLKALKKYNKMERKWCQNLLSKQ